MKKLILTISIFFTLISLAEARECKSGDIKGDAFIYSDGKKVTVIKGTDIPNPENKIIMRSIIQEDGQSKRVGENVKIFFQNI